MALNSVMAVILRYFSEFGNFRGELRKSGWRYTQTFRQEFRPKNVVFSDISQRYDVGNPSIGGLNGRGIAKYSDFRVIEGYISETVHDRR